MGKRPDNIVMLLFFSAGIVTACYSITYIMFLTVYILLGIIFLISGRSGILIIVFLAGSLVYLLHNQRYIRLADLINKSEGKEIIVSGTLTEVREYGMSSSAVIESDSIKISGKEFSLNARFNVYLNRTGMGTGDSLKVKGVVRCPKRPLNKYETDKRFQASVNYISAGIGEARIYHYSECVSGPDHLIRKIRKLVGDIFKRRLSYNADSFLSAVIMGDKNGLEASKIKAFAESGTIHLLAVSGLHVGFIILLTVILSSILRLRMWPHIIFSSVLLISYSVITGGSPSVIRAVIMAIILMLSRPFRRILKFPDIIGSAGIISLTYDPNQIFRPGFVLSFAAVISIALIHEPLLQKLKQVRRIGRIANGRISGSLLISFSVTLGLLPLILYLFGRYNFVSLLSNLILIPLTGAVFMSGIILVLSDRVSIIPDFIADMVDLIVGSITYITEYTASIELFTLHRFLNILVTSALIITIAAIFYIKKYKIKTLFTSVALFILIFSSITAANSPSLYVFKTSKGKSSIFINNGETLLFADEIRGSDVNNIIKPYIQRSNICSIDYLVTGNEWYQTEELLKLLEIPVRYVVSEKDHSFINERCDQLRISDLGGSLKTVFSEVIPADISYSINSGGNTFRLTDFYEEKGVEVVFKGDKYTKEVFK